MEWANLKSNECPACGSFLERPDEDDMIYCTEGACDFKIGSARFNQLVDDLYDDNGFGSIE